jgi:hypothetical protein
VKWLFLVISSSRLLSKKGQLQTQVVEAVLGGRKVPSIPGLFYRGSCGYGQIELQWLELEKTNQKRWKGIIVILTCLVDPL